MPDGLRPTTVAGTLHHRGEPATAGVAGTELTAPPRSLRVVAYNFLSGGSPARPGHWSRICAQLAPDIVLAQECRLPEDSPGERFRPGSVDALLWTPAATRRWGSAIFARGVRATPLRVRGFAGWVVGAELSSPSWGLGRPLRVFSIHCPVGERGYIRTMHEILDRIARMSDGADLLLGGDFNVAVGHRQPHERVAMSRGEREILDRLSAEFNLISCWQAANPGRPLAQTLRWSANRSAPYHCDGIFVPSDWSAGLVSCRVVTGSRWRTLSDHNPVVAELRMRHHSDPVGANEAPASAAAPPESAPPPTPARTYDTQQVQFGPENELDGALPSVPGLTRLGAGCRAVASP